MADPSGYSRDTVSSIEDGRVGRCIESRTGHELILWHGEVTMAIHEGVLVNQVRPKVPSLRGHLVIILERIVGDETVTGPSVLILWICAIKEKLVVTGGNPRTLMQSRKRWICAIGAAEKLVVIGGNPRTLIGAKVVRLERRLVMMQSTMEIIDSATVVDIIGCRMQTSVKLGVRESKCSQRGGIPSAVVKKNPPNPSTAVVLQLAPLAAR